MKVVAKYCVLELRAADRSGIVLLLKWEHEGQTMSYTHHMSGVELHQMDVSVHKSVMQQIRNHVERCNRPEVWPRM